MVTARRGVEGRLPLSALTRLRDSLLDTEGEVRFALDFDRDALQVPYVELRIEAELPLVCQRSLERFLLPVKSCSGSVSSAMKRTKPRCRRGTNRCWCRKTAAAAIELVEDELILAVPVVPMEPGTEAVERDWPAAGTEAEESSAPTRSPPWRR